MFTFALQLQRTDSASSGQRCFISAITPAESLCVFQRLLKLLQIVAGKGDRAIPGQRCAKIMAGNDLLRMECNWPYRRAFYPLQAAFGALGIRRPYDAYPATPVPPRMALFAGIQTNAA